MPARRNSPGGNNLGTVRRKPIPREASPGTSTFSCFSDRGAFHFMRLWRLFCGRSFLFLDESLFVIESDCVVEKSTLFEFCANLFGSL